MFRKGTRVQIIDEKVARDYSASVNNGDQGTIVMSTNHGRTFAVEMDNGPSFFIPARAIQRAPNKKRER